VKKLKALGEYEGQDKKDKEESPKASDDARASEPKPLDATELSKK